MSPSAPHALRGVIFDMDGTLLDTIGDIAASMNEALSTLGMPVHPLEDYRDFVGDGIETLARRALPAEHRDGETVRLAVSEMRSRYAGMWSRTTRPFPGVPEMLDELAGRGVRMSVLSNKLDEFTKAMANHFFPRVRFTAVRGLGPDMPRKPDPRGALWCAETMGVHPSRCVFVGDSVIDMETGRRAQMLPIGVLWGYQDRERLMGAGAWALAQEPGELVGFLDS